MFIERESVLKQGDSHEDYLKWKPRANPTLKSPYINRAITVKIIALIACITHCNYDGNLKF